MVKSLFKWPDNAIPEEYTLFSHQPFCSAAVAQHGLFCMWFLCTLGAESRPLVLPKCVPLCGLKIGGKCIFNEVNALLCQWVPHVMCNSGLSLQQYTSVHGRQGKQTTSRHYEEKQSSTRESDVALCFKGFFQGTRCILCAS